MYLLDQYILDAEDAFREENYLKGRELLEYALADEPTFAMAHNHMGWLYLNHLNDLEKAERHLMLAMKYSPNYGATYIHLAQLLFDCKRFDEHEALLLRALNIPRVSQSFIYNELGRNKEVGGHLRQAMRFYRLGIRWTLDEHELSVLKDNLRRCRSKRWSLALLM